MLGYANLFDQITSEIHGRLRSRAFVILSPCNGKRIAFVSADVGMIFHPVKREVVRRLQARFGQAICSDENLLISATHTYSWPGGYSHHVLYNAMNLSPKAFRRNEDAAGQSYTDDRITGLRLTANDADATDLGPIGVERLPRVLDRVITERRSAGRDRYVPRAGADQAGAGRVDL